LDLGDLASVKAFGERAEKELDRLDIVVSTTSFDFELIFGCSKRNFELTRLDMNASQLQVSNAGISTDVFKLTVDDFEST
jgi:NAD(P)-dependent dehydrogenase (short-subunit alcohol dehydrogenase family)